MPLKDCQQLYGCPLVITGKANQLIFHHHENLPLLETNLLKDIVEAPATNWEALWMDLGGEG